ncbi:hypothetical protein [Shewanella livingstonensis]|uniref:Uncharacterized protein n=1 Tax=Shewanella livingstonensis TaxID=150120 RepID=A0A3G8LSC3_9GAMM|nr:hypothetical protein [Shewanella livingstonensis]AZG72459.1 hypothetical protein EGC82_06525 [Shewanella livingstonensis]
MGLPRWNFSDNTERTIRIVTLTIVAIILAYEKLYGESATQYPAMYLCVFSLIATFMTNAVQRRYFTYVMEYAQVFRIVAILMTCAFFAIWLLTSYERLTAPATPSHLIYNL